MFGFFKKKRVDNIFREKTKELDNVFTQKTINGNTSSFDKKTMEALLKAKPGDIIKVKDPLEERIEKVIESFEERLNDLEKEFYKSFKRDFNSIRGEVSEIRADFDRQWDILRERYFKADVATREFLQKQINELKAEKQKSKVKVKNKPRLGMIVVLLQCLEDGTIVGKSSRFTSLSDVDAYLKIPAGSAHYRYRQGKLFQLNKHYYKIVSESTAATITVNQAPKQLNIEGIQ